DYAGRLWSGLLKDYYRPRWALFMDSLEDALKHKKKIDRKAFDKAVRKIDYQWTLQQNTYADQPTGDILKEASRIWKDYGSTFTPHP
ncbi:MAG: alpha-N-acetylglucosaminidase C-terminal domain-containing protein, partial [Massilibacteroides sp.]|nr:alpha-N-acetylglucosaminidase C-terminal domain-containing protein [Massilibacteroides sp.]